MELKYMFVISMMKIVVIFFIFSQYYAICEANNGGNPSTSLDDENKDGQLVSALKSGVKATSGLMNYITLGSSTETRAIKGGDNPYSMTSQFGVFGKVSNFFGYYINRFVTNTWNDESARKRLNQIWENELHDPNDAVFNDLNGMTMVMADLDEANQNLISCILAHMDHLDDHMGITDKRETQISDKAKRRICLIEKAHYNSKNPALKRTFSTCRSVGRAASLPHIPDDPEESLS